MAKRREEQDNGAEASDVLPIGVDAGQEEAANSTEPEAPAVPGKRWKIAPKSGTGGVEMTVQAETVEDAIRLYNGQSTSFSFKQLNIESDRG